MNDSRFGLLVVAALVALGVAVLARFRSSRTAVDFQLAGRQMGVLTNACAICGDYVSAASFLGVAAAVYAAGLDGAWFATGFAAGFVPVLLFVATPLRRFGDRSIPDFLAQRFESERVRLMSVSVVQLIILAYLVPQAVAGGLAWELFTDVALPGLSPYTTGIVASTLLTSVLVIVGGMRGTTWNQAIQFVALLGILIWLVAALYRNGFAYAAAVDIANAQPLTNVAEIDGQLAITSTPNQISGGEAYFAEPGARYDRLGQFALLFTLVFGTAGLPHVMNRFFTSTTGRAARMTTVWVIGLIGIFYALAVLAGTAARSILAAEASRHTWLEAMSIDGVLKTPEHALLALGRLFGGQLGLSAVTTGALLAIMSTIGGLLLAASASWGHDVYERHINPHATRTQALRAGQAGVATMAIAAAWIAIIVDPNEISTSVPSVIASLVTAAFALAGCGLTPVIILSIWWKSTTATGALAGMAFGAVSSLTCISIGLIDPTTNSVLQTPTLILAPLATVVIIVVSKLTTPVANIDRLWVRMHGSARDREAERLTKVTIGVGIK